MGKKIFIQILLALLIILIIFVVYQKYFQNTEDIKIPKKEEENIIQESNIIKNITYESTDNEGRKYIIKSETGILDENKPNIIYMDEVNAKIVLSDKSIIYIKSSKAEYNNLTYDTKFQNNISLNYLDHDIFCNNLNIFFKDNLLEAFNNLTYKNLDIIMLADKIEMDLLTKNSKIFKLDDGKIKIEKKNSDGNN